MRLCNELMNLNNNFVGSTLLAAQITARRPAASIPKCYLPLKQKKTELPQSKHKKMRLIWHNKRQSNSKIACRLLSSNGWASLKL
nr:MAG TPA: hypothetical protein [Caudoviricetes sp.]